MANLAKAGWSGPNQTALTSAVDQAIQYRQIVFAKIDRLRALGGVIVRSSNGTVVSTFQTQLFVVPASPQAGVTYRVVINGTNCDVATGAGMTQAQLRDAMVTSVNASAQAAVVTATTSTNDVLVTADVYTTFTHSVGAGPSPNITEGTAVAGVPADNIASVSDIVFGTEASQNHTHASIRLPATKGNPPGGTQFSVQINCNNSNADITPQQCDFYFARGTYFGGTGGTLTTRPSIAGGGLELTVLALNVVPWAAAVAGSLCTWYTTDGDFYCGVKANGDSFFRYLWWLRDDPTNALGQYNLTMFGISAAASDVVTVANIQTSANHKAMLADGSAAVSVMTPQCTSFNLNGWTSAGQEATTTRVPLRDVEILNNGAAAASRDYGALVDVLGAPPSTLFNQEDTEANSGNSNQWPMIHRTIGDLAIPCNASIT